MNVAVILKYKGEGVFTMRSDHTLLDVARELASRGIGCIVITDDKDAIAGIISERDVVRMIGERGPTLLDAPVSDAMTQNVVTCTRSDTIEQLMAEMTSRRFRHLPVVEDGRLIGIVSIGDVVKQRIAEAEMEAEAMRAYIATG